MSHVALLETIGQALLPAVASAGEPFDPSRFARDIWAVWAKDSDPAGRQADLHSLAALPAGEVLEQVRDVVKRILPGKAGPAQSTLTRYLSALPPLLRRLGTQGIEHAEELLRRLPPRVPLFLAGDRPPGVGDYELTEILRIRANSEVWLARNPELPGRPSPILVFFVQREEARRVLAWHLAVAGQPVLVPVEDTFLSADPPGLRFAPAKSPPFEQRAGMFRPIVEAVAALHARSPAACVGKLLLGDVFLRDGKPALLVLEPPAEPDPREDMPNLGRLGRLLLPSADGDVADALAACAAADPLQRPANAGELLARLPGDTAPPKPEPAPRPRAKRGGEVWKVLDTLQRAEPERPKVVTNAVGMRFVLVPAGKFVMGSPMEEAGRRDNEGPPHEVILTKPFYLAATPTTQEQYLKVMGVNPARFQGAAGGGLEHPVECVSWDEAVTLCSRLAGLPTEAGRAYRLPTEAEWEYACRAGSSTPFHFGPSLSAREASMDGHHPYGDGPRGPSAPRTAKVGSYPANHFGLFDMHGNVWEWCADWYDADYYQRSPRQDPPGPTSGAYRVLRGGSWRNQAATCRSAYRNALAPNQRQPFIGFRLVLETPS